MPDWFDCRPRPADSQRVKREEAAEDPPTDAGPRCARSRQSSRQRVLSRRDLLHQVAGASPRPASTLWFAPAPVPCGSSDFLLSVGHLRSPSIQYSRSRHCRAIAVRRRILLTIERPLACAGGADHALRWSAAPTLTRRHERARSRERLDPFALSRFGDRHRRLPPIVVPRPAIRKEHAAH